MLERWRAPYKKLLEPIACACVACSLSANAITIIGTLATVLIAWSAVVWNQLFIGALALGLAVIADGLDGLVAKLTHSTSAWGAFLDSTCDRIADWALLASVVAYCWWQPLQWLSFTSNNHAHMLAFSLNAVGVGSAIVAMLTSFVTSYARARSASLGYEVKNGLATRADRLLIILVSMGLSGLTGQLWVLVAGMMLVSLLGIVTVWQRLRAAARLMSAR